MLETLHRRGKAGPFLVVAPVSTLGHWQREVESLTDLYCVVYKGDVSDRGMIRTHEFGAARGRKHRFHVRAIVQKPIGSARIAIGYLDLLLVMGNQVLLLLTWTDRIQVHGFAD